MKQKLYTLAQAAKKIGCHPSTTTRHAEKLGIGLRIGRDVLVTEAEVQKLAKVIQPRPRQ
jgi:hypothetical protein